MKKYISLLLLLLFCSVSVYGKPIKEKTSLTVSVENTLFSPVAENTEGATFKTEVQNVKKTKLWFLTIRNGENNKKAREFIVKKTPVPETVVWDGLTSDGNIAPDGQYSYKFFVLGDRGSAVVEKSNVMTVDSTPPFVSLKCDRDVCFINQEDGKFSRDLVVYLSAGDENGIDFSKSYLEVLSYNDKRVKEFPFNGKIPEFVMWDGIDEVYNMPLPIGNYKVNFVVTDKAGNISNIDSEISIAPMPKEPEPELPKEVEVKQEERGLVINLSSKVLFDVSKSELKAEAEESLTEVSEILKVYLKNKVLIEGHTDSSGNKEKNMQLSIDRAQSVYDFFVDKGIDEERMTVFGFGSDKPVSPNDTEKGKEQNRRVEIIILKTQEPQPETAAAEETEESGGAQSEPTGNEEPAEVSEQEVIEDEESYEEHIEIPQEPEIPQEQSHKEHAQENIILEVSEPAGNESSNTEGESAAGGE
ncbi:MAG: OmpA family protein [Endomicrobium sp.]|jgi:outer membrane protein OmpA-like peptidoglycan-associated protein|nr:OmpA family protein [Endomicrobium sp.]